MKCVLLLAAIVAALMSVSAAKKTCAQIATCAAEVSNVNQNDMEAACKLMRGAMQCFDEAMADCKEQHPGMQQMDGVKQSMDQVKKMINDNCGSGAAGAATISLGLLLAAVLAALF